MTRVERFIEINSSPTNLKTILLLRVAIPLHFANWLVIHCAALQTPFVNLTFADYGCGFIGLGFVVCLAFSLVAARTGRNPEWPTYLMVVIQGTFVVGAWYSLGTASSPVILLLPLSCIMLMLYYERPIWMFGVLVGGALVAVAAVLDGTGVLPYAPALLARHVDEQQTWPWIIAVMLPVTGFSIFCLVYGAWTVEARKLQERRLEAARNLIRRYVPSQLAEQIALGGYVASTRTERRKLTLFFSDVEGFTNASDELDPEQLAELLNEYLSEMATIADRHGATLNQFVGDGIMIFFGAPTATDDRDHALRAVRMSLEMQRRMAELQQAWFKRGFQKPFRIRIGINTGYASVGDFGSQGRAVYSAIGLQTNLAARIQSHCEPGQILISHSTWALVHEDHPCESRGELQVKGIHYPIKVYQVLPAA